MTFSMDQTNINNKLEEVIQVQALLDSPSSSENFLDDDHVHVDDDKSDDNSTPNTITTTASFKSSSSLSPLGFYDSNTNIDTNSTTPLEISPLSAVTNNTNTNDGNGTKDGKNFCKDVEITRIIEPIVQSIEDLKSKFNECYLRNDVCCMKNINIKDCGDNNVNFDERSQDQQHYYETLIISGRLLDFIINYNINNNDASFQLPDEAKEHLEFARNILLEKELLYNNNHNTNNHLQELSGTKGPKKSKGNPSIHRCNSSTIPNSKSKQQKPINNNKSRSSTFPSTRDYFCYNNKSAPIHANANNSNNNNGYNNKRRHNGQSASYYATNYNGTNFNNRLNNNNNKYYNNNAGGRKVILQNNNKPNQSRPLHPFLRGSTNVVNPFYQQQQQQIKNNRSVNIDSRLIGFLPSRCFICRGFGHFANDCHYQKNKETITPDNNNNATTFISPNIINQQKLARRRRVAATRYNRRNNANVDNKPKDVVNNSDYLFTSAEFLSMDEKTLSEFLKLDGLQIEEIGLWNNILKWDFDLLANTLKNLIPLITISQISSTDFHNKIWPFRYILPDKMLEEIMTYHLDPTSPPLPVVQAKRFQFDSSLLRPNHIALISSWIDRLDQKRYTCEEMPYRLQLLLRGTQDGFDTETFHKKCDLIARTLVVMRNSKTGEIIGGYNPMMWTTSVDYKITEDSFLFSFGNRWRLEDARLSRVLHQRSFYAIRFNGKNYGPCFGDKDLCMKGCFNESGSCSAQKDDYCTSITDCKVFSVDEYEVFKIVNKKSQVYSFEFMEM
nr:3592_t:CDS:2 [Entrophospora candida]